MLSREMLFINSDTFYFSLYHVAELMKDLSRLIADNELEFATEFSDAIIQIKSILDTKTVVEVILFLQIFDLQFLTIVIFSLSI